MFFQKPLIKIQINISEVEELSDKLESLLKKNKNKFTDKDKDKINHDLKPKIENKKKIFERLSTPDQVNSLSFLESDSDSEIEEAKP